jgi:hypothetical protein
LACKLRKMSRSSLSSVSMPFILQVFCVQAQISSEVA